eukprot:528710-Pleurochrysis_carterae.AAC.3
MRDTTLTGLGCLRCDARKADFTRAVVKNVDFTHAKLQGAKFNKADISGSSFKDAFLEGVDFSGVTGYELADFTGAMNIPTAAYTG